MVSSSYDSKMLYSFLNFLKRAVFIAHPVFLELNFIMQLNMNYVYGHSVINPVDRVAQSL